MTDQQLALEAMSEAQRILKSISSPARTITSASWTGWSRYLRGPTSLSPSIVYSMVIRRRDHRPFTDTLLPNS